MTAREFLRLIQKRWKVVMSVTLVCALAGAGFGLFRRTLGLGSSEAVADIAVNNVLDGVASLAYGQKAQLQWEHPGTRVVISTTERPSTVTISVDGKDLQECVDYANQLAYATLAEANEFYAYEGHGETDVIPFRGMVVEARMPGDEGSSLSSAVKFGLIGGAGGLVLGICIVLLLTSARHLVLSAAQIVDELQLPVLATFPIADGGARLLANVSFAAGEERPSRVCVVPVGGADAQAVGDVLGAAAAQRELGWDFELVSCKSLGESIDAAYEARASDATVVVVKSFEDSMPALHDTLGELRLAGAQVLGVVLEA